MEFLCQAKETPPMHSSDLGAPDIVDDYYLNLLDWGTGNKLLIALGNTVYLRNASDGSTSELVTIDRENGQVTSVSWALDGRHIAVGLNNSESLDGYTVASAAGDERLMFWNLFGVPEVAKPAPKANPVPFAHWNSIR
ncbi:uncharacterized protein J3R85_005100 [Psidium guajava]|nr:uncharacterized protein J3R85_005100 [Psidium guajava]